MAISKEQRFYGQLIVDFANAGSTDEAGLKYFENIQKVFCFSPEFTDKAKANFPILNGFHSSLNDSEMQCFKLISEIKIIENEIAAAISAASLKYNAHSNIINVSIDQEIKLKDGSFVYDERVEPIGRDYSIDEIREMLKTANMYPDSEKYNANILSFSLPNLLELGAQIYALKKISKKRYKQISDLADSYANVKSEHGHIEYIQRQLNIILKNIIKKPLLSNSKMFKEILLRYNNIPKAETYLSDEGSIKEFSPFSEALFLNRKYSPIDVEDVYDGPISYCVVEFLRDLKNITYLKKCKHCKVFIITGHISRQFCDEPKECKKIHYTQYRIKRMREEYRNPGSPKFKVEYI